MKPVNRLLTNFREYDIHEMGKYGIYAECFGENILEINCFRL
jgi:hypothetical protein